MRKFYFWLQRFCGGITAAFGVAMFGVYALGHDERSSAISRRYRILVGAFAVIGIALSMWALALMAKVMSGAQNYAELSTHVFEMLLTGTHLGIAWCVRILALMTCAVIAILKLNPRLRFSVMAVSSGVGLATLAWAGHGAMDDGVRGYIHLASDVMHLWAAGAWIGALVAFFMLAVIKPGTAHGSVELLSRASNGFARIGTLIVATLVVSGVLNYLMIAGPSLSPLSSTLYGRLLLGKLLLFGGMLALAAANRFRLSPALEASLKGENRTQAVVKLRQSLFMEASLAVLIFAGVAWLGILSPNGT
ncbi:copper homeostasis membrane protein CopD [Bordetella petrii]|uniref:Copper resistance protein D n=1 Tax=Bordetella petrii (strain ATCC BAA-461 / DSM 12804 / CCUG 43448 / CIP 107267 / Se-1111R) TaxID=340100 RepID=A9IF00_BORPD|nr:copper homeostasis membrane protein CopD [Bordetella petrii]CAP44935.1 putative copper resistance protein D [Bordetella petrii]